MNVQWKPEEIDALLELLLPCNDQLEYERALVTFARFHGRGANLGIEEGDKLLRRRAVRRTDYEPSQYPIRTNRQGLPFSWCEEKVLRWSLRKDPESKVEPTPAYLAVFLQRTEEEVEAELSRLKNTKSGIAGFPI